MDDRELGRRIGYWRRRRKLTQAVFADRIGRSKSWVEKVERGERSAGRLSVTQRADNRWPRLRQAHENDGMTSPATAPRP
ncbi:MAG TPA: hypothetical protein DHU96_04885 [Actinobacteria bacterium]|nr:hypothetical protein [Actinomycetota bacterium]